MIYLCDIDGTIADCSHRLHFIEGKADWRSFFAACSEDTPIKAVIDTVRLLAKAGAEIIYVSGRSDEVRKQTADWLDAHGLPSGKLFMRSAGDHRQDRIVKAELLNQILSEISGEVIAVFDDRQQVVDMYRGKGLRVFQVAPGNF